MLPLVEIPDLVPVVSRESISTMMNYQPTPCKGTSARASTATTVHAVGRGGEIPAGPPPQPHMRQGELGTGKRVQDARARGPLRRAGGRALIEACEGFLRLRQSVPHLRFHQRQQPQRQGQEPRQPYDLLRLPDKQRT